MSVGFRLVKGLPPFYLYAPARMVRHGHAKTGIAIHRLAWLKHWRCAFLGTAAELAHADELIRRATHDCLALGVNDVIQRDKGVDVAILQ